LKTVNILVPFDRHSSNFKSLYHAFALAERIRAKVIVYFFKDKFWGENSTISLEKACLEMTRSACEEGISVSFHTTHEAPGEELTNIIKKENINLIVIDGTDTDMESVIKGIKPGASIQIIKVKGKKIIHSI